MLKKGNSDFIEIFSRICWILSGSLLYAVAINAFIAPHKLLSGGVAGIALLLQYGLKIPSGYWVLALNIPIFIVGLRKIDKDFHFFSIIGMFSMSAFLIMTKDIGLLLKVDDLVISTLFGAVISGLGMGMIFRNKASQGGTDIIAVIIKKMNGAKISTLYFILNGTIVLMGIFVTNLELTLYTVTLMYIKSLVIDKVIQGFDQKKMVLVVTSKAEEVSKAIMEDIGRRTTFLYGEGAYTGIKKKSSIVLLHPESF